MSSLFRKSFLVSFIVLITLLSGSAQTDSSGYETYDLIYLKKGGVLKGEILSFDEEFGGIVFKDTAGRKYSLAREEYDYFIEDKTFRIKASKPVLPRKEEGLEFSVGFFGSFIDVQQDFTPDDFYLNAQNAISDVPVGLKLAAGKFFNGSNYLGVTTNIPFVKQSKSYFDFGFRYIYRQDTKKKNAVFYIPIELKYCAIKYDLSYSVNDTLFTDNGFEFPSEQEIDGTFNTLSLNVGPGVSFILPNQKSINLEATFERHFILSQKFSSAATEPNSDFNIFGFSLVALYNF